MLRLYNTLTRKIEEFEPIDPPNVGYYSCGPTVYDFAHIGHARTYVFADVLHKTLELNGLKVKRVMNITDVGHLTSDSDTGEDKMEKGAKREKKTVWEIADFFTGDFFDMCRMLNIKRPDVVCKATDHVKMMIDLVRKLEKNKFTYRISDGVYFDTSKLPDYGKLTGKSFGQLIKSLKAGARIELVAGKKNITDFALWKFSKKGEKRQMEWESPWGLGFPGWHIECSAMGMEFLGDCFDIHTGGVDHIPIHHTNEIAQSEAATGKPFVKYWLHAEHLLVDGQKMSKSLKNFYRVRDLVKRGYQPLALRYLFLTASYRTQLNFTFKAMDASQKAYGELIRQVDSLKKLMRQAKRTVLSREKLQKAEIFRDEFFESLNDDLNTSKALAVMWSVIKTNIPPEDKYDLLLFFDEVLSLGISDMEFEDSDIPEEIIDLASKREVLRKEKKFEQADKVRLEIEEKGFIIEDTPRGSNIQKK